MPRLQFCRPQAQWSAEPWCARATHLAARGWVLLALAHLLLLEKAALAGDIHGSHGELSVEWVCISDRL